MNMTFDPRPHQQAAIDAVVAELAQRDRTTVTMMCGTGKTLMGQRLVERLNENQSGGRVLLLFPSLALVQQTFDGWTEQQRAPFRAIAFCSGEPVRSKDDSMGAEDLTLERTTDPQALASWLEADPLGRLSVVFGTYQSSPRIADAHDAGLGSWDSILFDEAHNTTGSFDSQMATALHQERIPAAKRVFMTATPKVHTKRGKKIAGASSLGIASMNDTNVYGRKAFEYDLPTAVADGVLNDYEVVVMSVSEPEVLAMIEANPDLLGTIGADMDEVVSAIALLRAVEARDLHRMLTFHSTVARAESFAAHLPIVAKSVGLTLPLNALTVKGADKPAQREAIKKRLGDTENDELTTVSNAKVYAEGVDIATLDGLLMADARKSPTEVTQIVGRLLRKNDKREGKSVLLLPVLVQPGDSPEMMLATGPFEKVWQTIIALSEHDTEMAADLAKAISRAAKGDTNTVPSLNKISFVATDGTVNPPSVMSAFELVAVDRCADPWDVRMEELAHWVAEHGRFPRKSDDAAGQRSHSWLTSKRTQARQGNLSTDNEAELDRRLPGWREVRDIEAHWDERLTEFAQWVAEHGRMPSHGSKDDAESRHGRFRGKQLQDAKNGVLSERRREALNLRAPGWDAPVDLDARWMSVLDELVAWVAANGRFPKDGATDADENRLSKWLSGNRTKDNKGVLREDREAHLGEKIPGWRGTDLDLIWRQKLAEVVKFREAHGRLPYRTSKDPAEKTLGLWLRTQLTNKESLNPERRHLLDTDLPGWDATRDDVWGARLAQLVDFVALHGRMPSSQTDKVEGEKAVGVWLASQRNVYRNGKLAPERLAVLNAQVPEWLTGSARTKAA